MELIIHRPVTLIHSNIYFLLVNPSLQVSEDGSYEYLDSNSFAGRTFLDLGGLLTGAEVNDTCMQQII